MSVKVKSGGHEDDFIDDTNMQFEKFLNTNYSEEFMSGLPERIRQRAQVLLHYNEEYEKYCKEFAEKEKALRRKYDELYLPFYERRKAIVTGASEPTEEEVAKGFPSEHEGKVDIKSTVDAGKSVSNIPEFWLRVLQNHVLSNMMIEKHDEKVLSHLIDIRSGVLEEGDGSFAVVFVFEPNEFFEEDSLMLGVVHNDDNSRIIRSGPTWKPGKDVTVEKIRKKPSGRGNRNKKPVTVTVSRPSFFGCFKEVSNRASNTAGGANSDSDDDFYDEEEMNEQIEQLLHVLHTSIIPCAVNFYTGEAPDGSSDMETDDDDDYDDDEEEEDEEEEVKPVWKGQNKEKTGGGKQQKECKQQ